MSNWWKISLAIAFLAVVSVHANEESDVVELNDSNFNERIDDYDFALVEFYAPWCGVCKHLAPEYEKAATILKSDSPPVTLIKFDCTATTGNKSCIEYKVRGFPTVLLFKKGEPFGGFSGSRDAQEIVDYVRAKIGPASKKLETVDDVRSFLNNDKHSIIGFFKSAELFKEFMKAANELIEADMLYRLAHTTSAELIAEYEHEDEIVIYQPPRLQIKLEASEKIYLGENDSKKIKEFIRNELHGLIGHRHKKNNDEFKRPLVILSYELDYEKDVKSANSVRNRFFKVAQKLYNDKVDVRLAVSNNNDFSYELKEFNYDDVKPGVVYVMGRGVNREKFKFEGELTPDNLEKFARDLAAGRLEVYWKSEPIPTENPDAVRTVVARTFKEIVNDTTKDVLIEFYMPRREECQKLAPIYEELAQKLKNEKDIVIAKINVIENDLMPPFKIRGFPTIYFVPKNAKDSPRKYEGGYELDDFIKYLAKEATDGLKGWDRDGNKLDEKTEL